MFQKCLDTKSDPHLSLLQMRSTPLGPGFLSPATLLFNCLIRDIMPIINRPPIGLNNNDKHYKALIKRQTKNDKNHDTPRIYTSFHIGSTAVVQHEDEWPWTHGTVQSKGDIITMAVHAPYEWKRQDDWSKGTASMCEANTAEQYLWDQLDKHIATDPLENILKQLEKQTHTNHHTGRVKKIKTIIMELTQITCYTKAWQQTNERTVAKNREVNNGQKVSGNNMPFHKNADENGQVSDMQVRKDMEE